MSEAQEELHPVLASSTEQGAKQNRCGVSLIAVVLFIFGRAMALATLTEMTSHEINPVPSLQSRERPFRCSTAACPVFGRGLVGRISRGALSTQTQIG